MTHPNLTDAEVIQADAEPHQFRQGLLAGFLVFVLAPLIALWVLS